MKKNIAIVEMLTGFLNSDVKKNCIQQARKHLRGIES